MPHRPHRPDRLTLSDRGFVGPVRVMTAAEARRLGWQLDARHHASRIKHRLGGPQLHKDAATRSALWGSLASRPALLDLVSEQLGPDILLCAGDHSSERAPCVACRRRNRRRSTRAQLVSVDSPSTEEARPRRWRYSRDHTCSTLRSKRCARRQASIIWNSTTATSIN
jgi:hypothetical protein